MDGPRHAATAAGFHNKGSQVKSTTNGLELMSGHPRAFSKPLFMLRGAVMHPGYHSSDWSQPGDSKTLRDLLYLVSRVYTISKMFKSHEVSRLFFEMKLIKRTCVPLKILIT